MLRALSGASAAGGQYAPISFISNFTACVPPRPAASAPLRRESALSVGCRANCVRRGRYPPVTAADCTPAIPADL